MMPTDRSRGRPVQRGPTNGGGPQVSHLRVISHPRRRPATRARPGLQTLPRIDDRTARAILQLGVPEAATAGPTPVPPAAVAPIEDRA